MKLLRFPAFQKGTFESFSSVLVVFMKGQVFASPSSICPEVRH
jgi:hypothetical protein